MAPLTAFSRTVTSAEEFGDSLADAFTVFASARPRPVHIEIPIDVLSRSCNLTPEAAPPPKPPAANAAEIAAAVEMLGAAKSPALIVGGGARAAGAASAAEIEAAADMLGAATSPALVVGGGARSAGAAIAAIAEACAAPIVTTMAAKGCVPDGHPLHLGAMLDREEVRAELREADVVLALGTELAETDTWSDDLEY